jgi:hypothetical protein
MLWSCYDTVKSGRRAITSCLDSLVSFRKWLNFEQNVASGVFRLTDNVCSGVGVVCAQWFLHQRSDAGAHSASRCGLSSGRTVCGCSLREESQCLPIGKKPNPQITLTCSIFVVCTSVCHTCICTCLLISFVTLTRFRFNGLQFLQPWIISYFSYALVWSLTNYHTFKILLGFFVDI